ncbi:MAG TPA: hypothetical protein VLL97_10090 [Acidobacteriota bacterium]|nr:hypothetical protein [Acidobacteriota bacterium]
MNPDSTADVPAGSFMQNTLLRNLFIFVFFALFPLLLYQPAFQNDTFWLINTGGHIVENGIPHTEPFSFHEGLDFIAQQWLTAVVFHTFFEAAGPTGLHLLIIAVYAAALFLMYRLSLNLARGKGLIAGYITAFSAVYLCLFMVPRPQVFSFLIFIVQISLLEYFIRDQKRSLPVALGLPALSLLLINFHAAIWPLFLIFMVPYLIDSFKFRFAFIAGHGYRKGPLIAGFLLSFIAGAVNPYGFGAMTYLLNSYGDPLINSSVSEMFSPDFKTPFGMFVFALVLVFVFIYRFVDGSSRLRFILITLGTLFMGLSSVRSFPLFVIFGMVFLSYYLKDIDTSKTMPVRRRALIIAVAFLAMFSWRGTRLQEINTIEEKFKPDAAVSFILNNLDISGIRLYNEYNAGGYIAFKGIKVFIDSRAEVFTRKLNGKADIFKDYIEVKIGKYHYADFVENYSFTHLLVSKDSLLDTYLKKDRDYRVLFEDGSYVLYEKFS